MLVGVEGVREADVSFFSGEAVVVVDEAVDTEALSKAVRGRYSGAVTDVADAEPASSK